jgi:dephospho-CoA kinase
MTAQPGPERPFLIGLSGPIGCGKSTIGRMLAELGGTVIDADQLARQATQPGGPTLPAIGQRFGDAVFGSDGSLDRAALADVVFDDPTALADLEQIVHPAVRQLVDDRLARAAQEHVPFAAVEAIKLVEAGLADRCDEVWLIECSGPTQRQRLRERGSSDADVERRLASQGAALGDRLAQLLDGRVGVRRLSTDRTLDETRALVEDTLAEALAPLVLGD